MCRRVASLAAVLGVMGCGSGPEAPPIKLEDACQRYAEVSCKKSSECVPPIAADCIKTQLDDCWGHGNAGGNICTQTSADAIAGCANALEAKSCDDYCNTSADGSKFCFAPCIWLCPG